MAVAVEFRTIPEMFQRLTAKFARDTRPVVRYKSEGSYKGISYSDLHARVETFANGLAALGVELANAPMKRRSAFDAPMAASAQNIREGAIADMVVAPAPAPS